MTGEEPEADPERIDGDELYAFVKEKKDRMLVAGNRLAAEAGLTNLFAPGMFTTALFFNALPYMPLSVLMTRLRPHAHLLPHFREFNTLVLGDLDTMVERVFEWLEKVVRPLFSDLVDVYRGLLAISYYVTEDEKYQPPECWKMHQPEATTMLPGSFNERLCGFMDDCDKRYPGVFRNELAIVLRNMTNHLRVLHEQSTATKEQEEMMSRVLTIMDQFIRDIESGPPPTPPPPTDPASSSIPADPPSESEK